MKRIIKVENYIPEGVGDTLRVVLPVDGVTEEGLDEFGFRSPFGVGQVVTPSQFLGPVSRRNSNGHEIVHRELPMETVTRLVSWTRKEWHGRDQVEVDGFIQRSYRRYPRTYHPGAGISFSLLSRESGEKFICSPVYRRGDFENILTAANILLEGFGSFEIVGEDLYSIVVVPTRRVDWDIFPEGDIPWDEVKGMIGESVERAPRSVRPVIKRRIESIEALDPDFAAVGRAGFDGYWAFGFLRKNIFILESRLLDNATYVFGNDWEALSRLSKADVIGGGLAIARIIHDARWLVSLNELFNGIPDIVAEETVAHP